MTAKFNLADLSDDELAELLGTFTAELHRRALRARTSPAVELVDRSSAPIAKRAWDRFAGKPGGFDAYRDGRKLVARRDHVLAWLEGQRVSRGAAEVPHDDDDRALERAGLRLVANGGAR